MKTWKEICEAVIRRELPMNPVLRWNGERFQLESGLYEKDEDVIFECRLEDLDDEYFEQETEAELTYSVKEWMK